VAQFDVPVHIGLAGAARNPKAHSAAASAACGPSIGLSDGVYRTFKNARFSGGWNTVSIVGHKVPVGLTAGLDVDLTAGVQDRAGVTIGASCEVDIPWEAMAGPVPTTGVVFGNVHGSVGGGVGFGAELGVHVHAAVSTAGAPPALVFVPDVSFSRPSVDVHAAGEVAVTVGFGAGVKFGLGSEWGAAATVNIENDWDFTAQAGYPDGSGCTTQAKFAAFDAEAKLGVWTVQTPSTPPLFTKTLWGPTSCEPTGSTGEGTGGGSGGGPSPAASPWSVQSTPEPNPSLPHTAILNDVSCTSTTSCVAVGSYQTDQDTTVPLSERWNGTSWQLVSAPAPPSSSDSSLYSVSCASASACTAVGYTMRGVLPGDAFAESWDGVRWQLDSLPNPGSGTEEEIELTGVSCTAPAVCTAVGWYSVGSGRVLLVERQNGASWSLQAPPSISSDNGFASVSCVSAARCVAVGFYYNTGGQPLVLQSFAETWDGTQWSSQPVPSAPGFDPVSELDHVSCTSASACTAVGWSTTNNPPAGFTLTERWDGTSWGIQSTPAPPPTGNSGGLNAVACTSSTVCTAVGVYGADLLAEGWSGGVWTVQTVPNPAVTAVDPPDATTLYGVSCPSSGTCFAVGHYHGGGALVERATNLSLRRFN